MLTECKDNLNGEEVDHVQCITIFNIVKISVSPKLVCRLNITLVKILEDYFVNVIIKKKNLEDFPCLKTSLIKAVWLRYKNSNID